MLFPELETRSFDKTRERTAPTKAHGKATTSPNDSKLGSKTAQGAPVCKRSTKRKQKRDEVTVCIATYKGELVEIKGRKIADAKKKPGQTWDGAVYVVTKADCLPKGQYIVKKGLQQRELELSEKMGIVVAHNNPTGTLTNPDHCMVMPFLKDHPRNLPSYKAVWKDPKQCQDWVEKHLMIVQNKVAAMRKEIGDIAHSDLCPGNTRWKSDNEVEFIDYGDACELLPVKDFNGLGQLGGIWMYEMCEGPDKGQPFQDPNVPVINAGFFGF